MFVLFAALAAPVAVGGQKTRVDGTGLGASRGTCRTERQVRYDSHSGISVPVGIVQFCTVIELSTA
jgi:hypothetical protein